MRQTRPHKTPADCGSPEHTLHRRLFLQGAMAASAASVASFSGLFSIPAVAEEARQKRQEVHFAVAVWCSESVRNVGSQARYLHRRPICRDRYEFARRPNQFADAQVRDDHGQAGRDSQYEHRAERTFSGHRRADAWRQAATAIHSPDSGPVVAQQLGQLDSPVPQFVLLDPCPEGNEFKQFKAGNWAGWLGAEYGPIRAGGEYSIPNLANPRRFPNWIMPTVKPCVVS